MSNTITGRDYSLAARTLTLRFALKLECAGLKRRGRSVCSIVKSEFGFKGNRAAVLNQLNAYINDNIITEESK